MESTFIWMLVFAGAAIALLGTFLVASERELKLKRREVASLAAKLSSNEEESGSATEGPGADTSDAAELLATNSELVEQISALRANLETSRSRIEELEADRDQIDDARLENRNLRAESQQLHETIAELQRKLQGNEIKLSQQREIGGNESRLQAEVAVLRQTLETTQARLREVAGAQERLAEAESRAAILAMDQENLNAQLTELKKELAEAHEKIRELTAAHERLSEMERLHQEMRDNNHRLQEEMSRLQERIAESEANRRRLETLRQSFDDLKARQAALAEVNVKFQADLAAFADLIHGSTNDQITAGDNGSDNPLQRQPQDDGSEPLVDSPRR
ncbi:MAG TPA: hypothetical protein VFU31_12335 [Candidatus Binatia bacterium]|nr:hypothetical protein [Candidatus Binatia bacterium]